MPPQSQISRADWLRCLQVYEREHLEAFASVFNYVLEEKEAWEASDGLTITPGPAAAAAGTAGPMVETDAASTVRFYRVVGHRDLAPTEEHAQEPEWYQRAVALDEDDPALCANPDLTPLPHLPLMPWPRLWPFLKAALGSQVETSRLDLPPIIARLARGQMLKRLPRQRHPSWAATCQVLIDFAEPLRPFWLDFDVLRQRLAPLRGISGLTVLGLLDGDPAGRCVEWSFVQKEWHQRPAYTLPEPGAPVLVLSDLGCNDATAARRRLWRRLGLRLRRIGCQPVALMPTPRRWWAGEVTQLFSPVCLDRGVRPPRRLRPDPGQGERSAQDAHATRLLEVLGAAIRVEPGLLRAVRVMLLPHVDVGSEAAAWNHAHVHTTPLAFAYGDDTVATYRAAFANLDDRALQQQVAALILAHHAHLSPAIAIEELCNLEAAGLAMHPEEVERVLAGLVRSVRQGAGNWMEVIRAWTERAARRLPQGAWQNDRLAALWTAAHLPQHQAQGQLTIPEGLDVNRVRWLFTQAPTPRHYALHQREGMLYAEPETPPEEAVLAAPGSLLGRLRTALVNVQVRYAGTGGGDAAVALQTLERGIALPEEGTLVLRTEHQEVRIESLTRPAWAEGIGCDPQGLFVTWAEDTRKAYWLPPGSYPVTDREAVPLGHRVLEKGFWCDAEEALALLQDGFRQSSWATGYGLDDYGLYAEFRIGEVTQRLRWIPPGEFRMGSPESEPERSNNETRHGVLLTQGFWLADTACTQALWQAVMGDNPSRFKGAERPVEQVSWKDVQVFLQRLNGVAPELGLRLPTEAEWEYACRAGTETPFWFGEQITPEQVNYNGNYPYAGGKKGLNRGETVSVKALPCNGWGLYQMHGNVWEWCQDWYAADADTSAESPAVDPGGPASGDFRVLRGGSWFNFGGGARSAQRDAGGPGGRYGCPGFRLARGQARIEAPEAPGKHRVHRAGQT